MASGGDEFAFLPENAAEAGLTWHGRPTVARRHVPLPTGGTVSALVWGDAPPEAVLLHGGGQNAHTWDTVALALARPLVAIDLPGHGHSSWRDDHDYRLDVLVAGVAAGIASLAPAPRLTVGMSLGGLTSIALGAARPDLVRQLMLVDITPGVTATKARATIAFESGPKQFASFDEILEHTVRHNPGRSPASLRRGVLHNARQLPDGTWSWRWDPRRPIGDGAAEHGMWADFAALWDDLSASTVPLALVRGSRSSVVDDADVAELLRRRPDADVVDVDGAGHSVQGDRPLELAALIERRLGQDP